MGTEVLLGGKLVEVHVGARGLADSRRVRIVRDRVLEHDRRITAVEKNSERDARLIREVVLDMLSVNLVRRLRGPALLVLGIIVGAAANIAASA